MKQKYNVYIAYLNKNTLNWDGKEWVIDGERGRATYPGDLELSTAIEYYEKGIDWNDAQGM